jgi:DNA repair exonuclease SbcCD ATPase subunit
MKLLSVEAKNLFSVGHVMYDLRNRGLVLVDGYSHDDGCSNGSGKSTVANKVILWTLFGRTASGIRADSVVNRRHAKQTAQGSVYFEGKGGDQYAVHRHRNPSKLVFRKYSGADSSDRHQDLSCQHEKDTQEAINQVLGRDFNTFLHTDFFGQGRKDSFLELTPKAQAELLEEILPIDQLESWTETAKVKTASAEKLLSVVSKEIISYTAQIQEIGYSLNTLESSSVKWMQNHRLLTTDLGHQIANAPSIDDLLAKRDALIPRATTNGSLERATRELAEMREARGQWLAHAGQVDPVVSDKCHTCDQDLPQEHRDKVLKKIEEQAHRRELAHSNAKNCSEWIRVYETEIEAHTFKQELKQVDLEISEAETSKLQVQLEELEREVDPYAAMIINTTARRVNLTEDRNETENVKTKLKRKRDRNAFWAKAFSKDFKALLFQKACPFLQLRTKQHLEGLGNSQLKVTFSTARLLQSGEARDEFNITVKSDTGGESYDTLSGGEQQMVSFAVGLALADLASAQAGGPSYFMILDEPFVSLSEKNCENIVNYLQDSLSKVKSTILLISNEPYLKDLVPEKIMVAKRNGVTSIDG